MEDWLDAMEHASKAQGNKSDRLSQEDKEIEEKRFENKDVKNTLKWLLLREHLPTKIAKEVRTFEIANNEGLGLNNSKLIKFVRQLEKNKGEENDANFTKVGDWKNRRSSQDNKTAHAKLTSKEFTE